MHAGVTGDRPLKNFSLPTPYCSQGGQPLAHFPTAMMAYLTTRGSEPRARTEPSEILSQGSFFPLSFVGCFLTVLLFILRQENSTESHFS